MSKCGDLILDDATLEANIAKCVMLRACSLRVRQTVGSNHDRVKPKIVKIVFATAEILLKMALTP
jgi:hypothetical protein